MAKQTYKEAAEMAAEIEQAGDYRNAARLWGIAANLAKKMANQEWCEHRADFCRRVAMRPFKEADDE
ncbi:ANR family transcriptional regulator [Avibacterium avium]|uniref:ANR family transcriptional regulator n=1 Tax=Avibacterium avium TaxID=751 RepID=UPI003BF8D09F